MTVNVEQDGSATEAGSGFDAMDAELGTVAPPADITAPKKGRRAPAAKKDLAIDPALVDPKKATGPAKVRGAKRRGGGMGTLGAREAKRATAPKAKRGSGTKPAEGLTVEQYRALYPKATEVAAALAVDVVAQVLADLPALEVQPRQQFLGLKHGKATVLSVIPMKAGLRLVLPVDPSEHLGIAGTRDVSNLGHWGVGGLEWKVDADTDPGAIINLVRTAIGAAVAA